MSGTPARETDATVPSSSELALERTRLANERTLMAWIRTSVSLISFGFSIYKFFDFFRGGQPLPSGIIGPRRFAIAMIGIGLFALAAATAQHLWDVHVKHKPDVTRNSLANVVAGLVALAGLWAMTAVILRQ